MQSSSKGNFKRNICILVYECVLVLSAAESAVGSGFNSWTDSYLSYELELGHSILKYSSTDLPVHNITTDQLLNLNI